MPRRGVVLRSVAVAVAVLLFLFASNHALAQEDEVDAFVEAEVFEPEAIAEMEAFIGQEEAALEPSMMPQFSAFTGEADEQLAESSEVIGPIANPTADPVLGDGEFVIRKTHLHVPGFGVPFEVALTYRSRANHQSSLGFGWSHNYARHIEDILPSGGHDCEGDVVYVTEAMERITFRPVAESYRTGVTSYRPTAGEVPLRLEKHENGPSLYVVTDGSGLSYGFNKVGGRFASLTSVSDTAGNSVTITWDNSISNDDGGIVTRVIDTSGRNFFYNYLKRTRERDPARCGQLGILGFFDDACRTIAVAQLQCVSQQQNDCSAPLVSFQQTVPDNDNEFDLTRVLDADGNGPTFTYLGGFSKAAYVADDMLTPACHLLCDRQNDAPRNWSCHNQDVCTQAIDNAIDTLCRGVANPFVAPRNGYNCSTYCYQACQDPSQTCLADGFDHKSSLNYVSCGEEDDFDPGPDKNFWHTLCECDVASSIGICNSPSPQVQAGIAANQPIGFSNVGSKDECHDVAKDASASVAHTDVCTPFSAACYAKIGNDIRTNNADCSAKCFQDCHENDGALDANGKRRYAFGRPQDLNHDLVEVRDGDGRLVVHNDYGQDPFEIDFDRVVKNRAGDATDSIVTYQYHHLRAEQAIDGGDFQGFFQEVGLSPAEILAEALSLDGGTPVYAVHPDPANVLPLSSFGSVDICNDSCSRPAVQPPITGVMSAGVLQLSSIDPQKSGAVWIGEPLVLKLSGRGIYSILSGPRRELAAGEVLWATASRSGGVRLRATADPNTFAIEGDHSSIATAFGPESKLELRQGVGLSYSAKVPTERLLTARESRRPTPISNRARPAVKTVSGRPPLGLKLPRTTPAPDSLFSTAMARAGFSLGSAPVILERKGNVATFLSPEAGTELAHAQSAKGKISIKATGAARTLALEGPVNTISDHEGRIAIVSLPGGRLAAVPLSAILGERRVDLGLDQAITDGLLTDGMACSVWRHGPPRVGSAATDAQRPEYAVVIHDLHGITRTEYYDKAWRLLRNTNRTTGETIDYNYRNGTLHGVRDAAGTRLCIAADYYGKPLNVTRLPAPGAPGDSQPHVTQYSYTSHGALVDLVKDPGLPSQSAVHRERDTWDRVLWIQNQVGSTSSVRTTYSYDLSPLYNAHSIFPIRIVTPDGTTTSLSYDPNGAGPTQITTEVPGSSPLQLYVRYDALGRVIEQGRNSHWGSIVSHVYDAAGLVTQEAKADALHVGQWLTTTVGYNRSRQRFHEVGPRLERWLTFDPLDHAQIVIEVPSGGGPQKSHCERYSSDGRLDYTIDPEGIVRHNIYDGNNRLARVDLGHPRDLSLWTNACLSGAPAPLPLRPFPQPSPIGTLGRRTSTARGTTAKVKADLVARNLPAATFKLVSQPPVGVLPWPHPIFPPAPKWPATFPRNDSGMQTVTVRKYAPGGALISDTDGSGVGKFYVRDGFGRVIDETNADPATADAATIVHHWFGYDTQDRVIWQATLSGVSLPPYAKPSGLFPGLQAMVERQYDRTGRIIGEDTWRFANGAPLGAQLAVHTSYAYDDAHRTRTITVGNHAPRVTAFDTLGRQVSDLLPSGDVRTATWREVADGDEQDVTEPAPNGLPLTLTEHFDDRGLGTGTRQGADELVRKVYDSYGQLSSTITGQLITTNYSHDSYGRLASYTIIGAPGPNRSVRFAYDGDDRRTRITTTNALGDHSTNFVIDGLGRVIETDAPLGRVTTRTYVPGSFRLSSVTDPAGTTLSYTYDAAGQKLTETASPGSAPGLATQAITRSFTYSPFGINTARRTTVPPDVASGSTVTISYDSMGHRVAESSGSLLPFSLERVYDDLGGVTSTTIRPTSGTPLVLSSTLDELGRVADIRVGNAPLAHLTYAGLGDATAIDFGGRATTPGTGTGVTARLSYDARGRRTGIDVSYGASGGDAIVAKWHDAVGLEGTPRARIRQLSSNTPRVDLYEIDAAGPLIAEADDASLSAPLPNRELVNADVQAPLLAAPLRRLLTLDGEANWISVTTDSQTAANSIDAADAYTSFAGTPLSTNATGETVSTGLSNLVFDGFGEPVQASTASGSISYQYDALGRRFSETVSVNGQSPISTYFLWDDAVLRATTNSATDASQARVYVRGSKPQDLLGILDGFGTGPTYYVHQGNERSVFALSNDSGLIEGYLYDAFGTTRIFDPSGQPRGSSAVGMRLLYQGQLYDTQLATYAMGAREYSPALGRFLSPDPLGFVGGDNLYAFAAGMPLTRVDPTGLASQAAIDDSPAELLAQPEVSVGALSLDEEDVALETAPLSTPMTTIEDAPDLGETEELEEATTEMSTGSMPTPLTPVTEAEDNTPFEPDSPVSQPIDEVYDEEATRGINDADLWDPGRPTDPSSGSGTYPAYNTLSGHGFWDESAAQEEPEIMPEDKRLYFWGGPGMTMRDAMGEMIESGVFAREPDGSIEPGQPIPPQLKLRPPGGLQIGSSEISNVITIPITQSAADLIINGPPGDYYWCACMTRYDVNGLRIQPLYAVTLFGIAPLLPPVPIIP